MSLVELDRYDYSVQAEVVRLLLGSHGIEAFLFDVGLNYVIGGGPQTAVRLMVMEDDLQEAVAIVAAADSV